MKWTIIALALCVGVVMGECPNGCSGHGKCNNNEQCVCQLEGVIINPEGNDDTLQAAWTGADCSRMTCPRGTSWIRTEALPSLNKVTYCNHAQGAECSDKGLCNRQNGQCSCFPGYTGAACHRSTCPNDCSGHGICQSNVKFAQDATIKMQPYRFHKDGLNAEFAYLISYDNAWDSGLHYGCKCDVGYRGPDCSLVECPSAEDPLDDFCEFDLAITEFVGSEWFFSQSLGKLNPQMAPLPNKLLLYVENYIDSDILHEETDDFGAAPYAGGFNSKCSHLLQSQGSAGHGSDYKVKELKTSVFYDAKAGTASKAKTATSSPVNGYSYPFYVDSDDLPFDGCLYQSDPTKKGTTSCYSTFNKRSDPTSGDHSNYALYARCVQNTYCGGHSMGNPCSGRGLCNYEDGTCKCHEGYSGNACQNVEALI